MCVADGLWKWTEEMGKKCVSHSCGYRRNDFFVCVLKHRLVLSDLFYYYYYRRMKIKKFVLLLLRQQGVLLIKRKTRPSRFLFFSRIRQTAGGDTIP